MYYRMILQVILLKKKQITKEKIVRILKNEVNNERLSLLLDNLDEILSLINKKTSNNITSNITGLRSNINDVKSFRIDTGIYEEIKNYLLKAMKLLEK